MKKINENKIYKVEWNDIASHTNVRIERPYRKFLCKSETIGRVDIKDGVVIVSYAGNVDGEKCFDAIPKSVVINISEIK